MEPGGNRVNIIEYFVDRQSPFGALGKNSRNGSYMVNWVQTELIGILKARSTISASDWLVMGPTDYVTVQTEWAREAEHNIRNNSKSLL